MSNEAFVWKNRVRLELIDNFCFAFIQSMVAFLKDPSGPPLWEENPEAKDIIHIETEKVSNDLYTFLEL